MLVTGSAGVVKQRDLTTDSTDNRWIRAGRCDLGTLALRCFLSSSGRTRPTAQEGRVNGDCLTAGKVGMMGELT